MRGFEQWFRRHQANLWVATLLVVLILGAIAAAPRPRPARWEYTAVKFYSSSDITKAAMNKLGADGWRCAHAVYAGDSSAALIFERQK